MIIKISKGQQITIPSKYRKHLNLNVGSKVEITKRKDRLILQPLGEDLNKLFENARKIRPKRNLTAKQMDEEIENEILR